MTVIPYSRLHPAELADFETKYGRELDEAEALYLLRQERENGMREQIFYGTEPRRTGAASFDPSEPRTTGGELADYDSAEMPTVPSNLVTANQIVDARDDRWPWQVLALILLALIVGEAWLAVHYKNVIESWFRWIC